MSPALTNGDRFIGRPAARRRPPPRGSVVAFTHPHRSGFWLVKRVVGLGGEVVSIDTGEVLIDGRAGLDVWGHGWSTPDGEWQVPDGELFVLSDQRPVTRDDSRSFGPIATTDLYRMIFPPGSHKTRRQSPRLSGGPH